MPAMVNGNEIALIGAVGDPSEWGWEDCFTASDVLLALAQVGDTNDVTIRLNSGGGIATEGSAIHAALARHKGKKTVIVEGIAASAATVIAMAGDDVVMALGALMMIHEPSGFTVGTIADHQAQITALTALAEAMATIYAAKCGQGVAACRADMEAEIWLTADQAVAKGYADRVVTAPSEGETVDPAPFDYTLYANAPTKLVAMSQAKHWIKPHRMAAPTPLRAEQETRMPNITEEDLKTRIDAAKAEGKAEAEAKATEASASMTMRSQASEIAKLCVEGGVPAMASALLAEGVTVAQVKARIEQAGEITGMVALARKANPSIAASLADDFIASGKTVDQVRGALFDKMVAARDGLGELRAHHRAGAGGADREGDPDHDARATAVNSMKAELKRQGLIKEGA